MDCGSLVWFLTSCWHVELGFANLCLLVLRLIMPQPEWWPTRRWPPLTPTEKDSQLYHTVQDLKSFLHFVKNVELRWECHICYVGANHNDKNKVCYRSRIMALNLGMVMWLVLNAKIGVGCLLLLIGTERSWEWRNWKNNLMTTWRYCKTLICFIV